MNLSSKGFPLEWRTFVSSILKNKGLYCIRDRYTSTKYTQQIIMTFEVKFKHI